MADAPGAGTGVTDEGVSRGGYQDPSAAFPGAPVERKLEQPGYGYDGQKSEEPGYGYNDQKSEHPCLPLIFCTNLSKKNGTLDSFGYLKR